MDLVGTSASGTKGRAICLALCAGALILYAYLACVAFVVDGVVFAVGYITGNAGICFAMPFFTHFILPPSYDAFIVFAAVFILYGGNDGAVRYRGHTPVTFKR